MTLCLMAVLSIKFPIPGVKNKTFPNFLIVKCLA
jgi:hypothetical protein